MKKRPPNIILTIADDQRGSALGCAGLEPVLTPHLDALAARGARFPQACHFGSCHGAVCAPSRAMLFTGLPYFRLPAPLLNTANHPAGSAALPAMLGRKLARLGYHTFATGKWHNGVPAFRENFEAGANLFFGGMADHWFTPVHDFDPSGRYAPEAARIADGFSTEVFAQSAIDYLRSRRGSDRPFFCYCAFTAPHDPRTPPDAWLRRYDPSQTRLPPNVVADQVFDKGALGARHPFDNGSMATRDELLLGHPRDIKELRRATAAYHGMISHMDEWIGRIHAAARELGDDRDTVIVHTADHGLAVGQHGLVGKQNLYEHSVRVPLIIAGAGLPAGRVSDALCYQHDLHPTLLELAGAAEAPGVFRSLLPSLRGDRLQERESLAVFFQDDQRMIRDARHKLIDYHLPAGRRSQLFDLQDDPWETRDLSASPSSGPIVDRLRAQLRDWQRQVGDPLLQAAAS